GRARATSQHVTPALSLRDSHILSDAPSLLHGSEVKEAFEDDNGAGFSVIAVPAAEPGADPGSECEGAFGIGVFLLVGLAFKCHRYAFDDRELMCLEDILEGSLASAIAVPDELHHADGSDQGGSRELFERPFCNRYAFDVEASGLQGAEEFFDHPAPLIQARNPARGGKAVHWMAGEEPPTNGFDRAQRIDFAHLDEAERHLRRQTLQNRAYIRPLDLDRAKAHRQHCLTRRPAGRGRKPHAELARNRLRGQMAQQSGAIAQRAVMGSA